MVPLTPAWRQRITRQLEDMTEQALGCWRCAEKALPGPRSPQMPFLEQGLTFLGLVGLMDPTRPEVKQAVATARQ